MDHFARLGLPAALDLDAAALDKAYFARQRQWHPDRFVGKPAEQRAKASVEAAALNDAYRTLKDPLARAIYLAELNGIELPGDGKTIDDPELLISHGRPRGIARGEQHRRGRRARKVRARGSREGAGRPVGFIPGKRQARHQEDASSPALPRQVREEAKARRSNLGRK